MTLIELKEAEHDLENEVFEFDNFIVSSGESYNDINFFKIYDKSDCNNYCRIYMDKARYIDCEDELLKLSDNQIINLINKFNERCEFINGTNWQGLIYEHNTCLTDERFPIDLQIPDYTKL